MNQTTKNILARIKSIDPSDAIYASILIVFSIVIIVAFFIAVRFISSNINAVFTEETSSAGLGLNMERYKRIIEKLGITTSVPADTIPKEVTPLNESTANTGTSTPETATTSTSIIIPPPSLERSAITLLIKNSTTKKGAASVLAETLKKAGFASAATGNEQTKYTVTTVILKESRYDYASLILEEVLKSYQGAVVTKGPDTAPYDATIIIGEK